MSYLKCTHCGTEKSYADANISDIRGETCSEHTETNVADSMEWTRELDHEWVEVSN